MPRLRLAVAVTAFLGRHFRLEEFRCRCGRPTCDAPTVPAPALVSLLDNIRDDVGVPLTITSGLRCSFWNQHEGGEPNSGHLTGTEADVACPTSRLRYFLLVSAITRGVRRIGIGKSFVHFGVATGLPQDVIWTYYP